MVTLAEKVVQAKNRCSVCSASLTWGEYCLAVVKLPTGDCDTVCADCWHTILVSAGAWLRELADEDEDALQIAVDEAERILKLEKHH